MSEENKENPSVKNKQQINELLMKPFSLGWTREVVRRVVTHNKTPNCDIYYFSPNKKKLRSLTEVKSNLTDGLSPECFSFKREPLGLSPDLETVRDAKSRGKNGTEKSKEKIKSANNLRTQGKPKSPEQVIAKNENETTTENLEDEKSQPIAKIIENGENSDSKSNKEKLDVKDVLENEFEIKLRRTKPVSNEINKSKIINNKKKTKTKAKSTKSVKKQSVKNRKTVLKKVMNAKKAKQAKVVPSRKLLKQIVKKKVTSPKQKLSKTQRNKKVGLNSNKTKKTLKLKAEKKSLKNSLTKGKNEVAKKSETNETDKKSATRDLKSIVKKNIGKYRELREKQKLGVGKTPMRNASKRLTVATVSRSRSEPISKNRIFYLKPLEKGWRRELVFRTNCAKAGQQADVYYFHPNGKKLRSCREIAENLTHGLSIDCFTFRKEPIGCGEPSEVIRNARSHQKN